MGKKGANRNGNNSTSGSHQPQRPSMTLREESTGKGKGKVNAKTMCKIDHLKNLALWTASEVCVPSLGAFFGQFLAASTESVGIRSDPNLFFCQRCESILRPGQNCTVHIEKNKPKKSHSRKKSNITTQNSVVYNCHFCSHRNLMRGTPKGHVKELSPPKAKPPPKLDSIKHYEEPSARFPEATPTISEANKLDTIPIMNGMNLEPSNPTTPFATTGLSFLDSKKKRNRPIAKKVAKLEGSSTAADIGSNKYTPHKRRRKSWTSLKEMAHNGENDTAMKLANLTVPFFI